MIYCNLFIMCSLIAMTALMLASHYRPILINIGRQFQSEATNIVIYNKSSFTKELKIVCLIYNYFTSKTQMGTKTLYNIIDSIQVSRIRLSRYPLPQVNNSPWTTEEDQLFYKVKFTSKQLMLEYGTDLGLIQSFFPSRSRNQIKRKHRDISELKKKAFERLEQRRIR